jgi:hypothetical protein
MWNMTLEGITRRFGLVDRVAIYRFRVVSKMNRDFRFSRRHVAYINGR